MPRIIVYTGAPVYESLSWDEDQLTTFLLPCFTEAQKSQPYLSIDVDPKWRSLPFEQMHLPTGFTQATNPDFVPEPTNNEGETSFLSTTDLSLGQLSEDGDIQSSGDAGSDIVSQYYEHSFAVHDDLPSSQILPAASPPPSSSSFFDSESSFNDSTVDDLQRHASVSRFHSTSITSLSSIPTASYLHSINPQTMTVNLLVGVISIPPARTLTTRKDNQIVDLIEMIVGDDVKAGFGVNVWLPRQESHATRPLSKQTLALEEQMRDLRPRDVVLMRNVALASFKGRVYGQSLRKGMTSVELVWRGVIDDADRPGLFEGWEVESGGEAGMEKVKRVREWVLQFVGGGGRNAAMKEEMGGGRRTGKTDLPDDTQ
ncbi:MAG: hypothetical protein LQ346_008028 [Caloplaca aetnensis]|nr:MAG: hypothetical protein LQ346_008028 [Caloplaca aetnensis]